MSEGVYRSESVLSTKYFINIYLSENLYLEPVELIGILFRISTGFWRNTAISALSATNSKYQSNGKIYLRTISL